jgi:hypothetical protein
MYQSVCPFVRIRPPSECVPPGTKGGGGQHSLAGKGAGGAKSDDWRESLALRIQYSVIKRMYTVLHHGKILNLKNMCHLNECYIWKNSGTKFQKV